MGWIIGYLVSVIVIPFFYAFFHTMDPGNESNIVLSSEGETFLALIFCLFWPITIPRVLIKSLIKSHKESTTDNANKIVHNRNLRDIDRNDRTFILEVPEWELKYVFKAYRKKLIELKSEQIEIIREELLNRNMERNLLK